MEEKKFKEIFNDLSKRWKVIDKGYKNIHRIKHPDKNLWLNSDGDLEDDDDVIYVFSTGKTTYKIMNDIIIEKNGVIAINLS